MLKLNKGEGRATFYAPAGQRARHGSGARLARPPGPEAERT